ncbi:MAG: tetratricopeptide repeat protein [Pseudomonadota bacterium]
MPITALALSALFVASAQSPQPVSHEPKIESVALASDELAKGRLESAIAALEQRVADAPNDPALLINLGIAHAQSGSPDQARAMFERALVSPEPIELETANGEVIDSRRLARKAMRMLERGEFTAKLTRRD